MILKFQQGGALPPLVSYQPVTVTGNTQSSTKTSKTSKKDSSDLTDKDLLDMLDKLDGLPSDMQQLTSELQNFYIDSQYGFNTSNVTSKYMGIISKIRTANFNKKQYDAAFEILKGNGGLNEVAINEDGRLFCMNAEKDFKLLTPEELNQQSEYQVLTNSQLLEYRAYNPETAFNTSITATLQNGIGIQSVNKMIQEIISKLGTTSKTEEGYTSTDARRILSGIKDFENASKEVSGNFNPTLNNLYKYKAVNSNQVEQIQQAFNYIYATLPENAKSLLKYKARNIEGGLTTLLGQMINSQHTISNEFTLDLDTPNTGSSSSKSKTGGVGDFKMDPVSLLQAGYGQQETITIQTAAGGSRGIQVPTVRMPIYKKSGDSIGTNATLADVSESGFAGFLNFENASMGGAMINTTGFNNIVVNGTALYVGDLPIDLEEYYHTGNIKPDIDMLGKYKQAQQQIAENNITDKNEINAIYQKYGLPIMYGENGDVLTNYKRFGMINANALDSAFSESAEFADWLSEVNDEGEIQNVLNILNKGKSDSDRIDFDAKSGWDSVMPFLNSHNSLYKGTLFIPVNEDHFTATSGFGNHLKPSEVEAIAAKQQALERSTAAKNGYNNPGNKL